MGRKISRFPSSSAKNACYGLTSLSGVRFKVGEIVRTKLSMFLLLPMPTPEDEGNDNFAFSGTVEIW